MGLYKYIRDAWKQPDSEAQRTRYQQWRKEPVTMRLEKPTRLDRARSLGYRAKPGIFVVLQRVMRGGRQRPYIVGGRRPKTSRQRLVLNMSYQMVAEMRAQKKYPNCEVLNSYNVGKDGKYYWYDIIMVDRAHPAITSDKDLAWIANHRGRVFRGKTSAGRKSKMG